MYDYQKARRERQRENGKKRRDRLKVAREKGIHSPGDWEEMVTFFEFTCVKCFDRNSGVVKDHIVPIYQEGSDGLDNLQPLCQKCNCAKGPERIDYRSKYALSFGITLPSKYKC